MEREEVIKEQFKKVIKYSQGISDPQVDDLFDKWRKAKESYIKAFGGELIFEYPEPISFDLGPKEKNNKIDDFITIIERRYENYALASFIDAMRKGFFDNETICDYAYGDEKIQKGTKLVKAFKYFEEDKTVLTDLQNAASRIIQEDKITGKLCLSVHPLDFLSSSENASNWRSCHALDGEYRAGNLSYMVDSSTIICYLKSEEGEAQLPNFPMSVPWNNKKWRMLLFFSGDKTMMFAGRQYPFTSSTAPDIVKDKLLAAADLGSKWSPWHTQKMSNMTFEGAEIYFRHSYVPVGRELIAMDSLIIDGEQAMNFNDLLRSSCYDPMYSYRQTPLNDGTTGKSMGSTRFLIGGPVKCLDCGGDNISISETMRCIDCEEDHGNLDTDEFGYCSCCGRHMYLDNAYWVHDDPVCSHCFQTEVEVCYDCGDYIWADEARYCRSNGHTYCHYCYDNNICEEDDEY